MEINIRPAMPEERKYAYTPSMDIIARTRCIGHLRGDMDTYGNGCYTSWDDHNRSLKTDEFKQRFDDVIEALRHDEAYGGILKNRRSLEQYCQAHPEAKYSDEFRTYYIFRADEGDYAYLLRCDYREGVYNVYIYAYERLGLEQHMEKARNGIRFVDSDYREAFTLPDGDKLKIVSRDGESVERICRYIDPMHFELGDVVFHIHEFAERMSEMGKQIIPLRSSLPEHCYLSLIHI